MGAGAWGAAPAPPANEDDSPKGTPTGQPKQPAFGSSYRANPVAAPTPTPVAAAPSFNSGQSLGTMPRGPLEADLSKKEKELAERERKLAEREKELGIAGKKKNWPICFPIWRHDIAEDIPEKSRRVVREAYLCWWLLVGCLSYQFFCATVMLGYGVGNKVPSWFLSIIFWITGVPLSIWLWYKRIYSAAVTESAIGYMAFFFFFFCHWAWCVFCAVGVQINAAAWCFSGFMAGIVAFDASTFAGIIFMIGGALWSLLACYSMWVLKDAWYFFRGQGGIREVKSQAANEAALVAFKQAQAGNGNANRV